MALDDLPALGLDTLRAEWGKGRTAKAKCPPVALTGAGPVAVYYLRDVESEPDETPVVWAWPGQWRNDVFQTTLGAIR